MEFKVGNKVILAKPVEPHGPKVGSRGVVRSVDPIGALEIGVEFPTFTNGHDLSEEIGAAPHGWYVPAGVLKLAPRPKLAKKSRPVKKGSKKHAKKATKRSR